MPKTLDEFVSFYQLNQSGSSIVLDWVNEVYDPVFPIELKDPDLQLFLSVLYQLIRFYKPENVVQTGTFTGTSSLAIAKSFTDNNKGMLFTIDPEPFSYFGVSNPVDIAREVVGRAQMQDRISFIKGYSTIANDKERMYLVPGEYWRLKEIAGKVEYDILVIDGDHTFLGCFYDLYYGAAGLSANGPRLIVVHDYLGIPSVKKAVRLYKSFFPLSEIKIIPSPCGIALIRLY
jgi:hypothetical protein